MRHRLVIGGALIWVLLVAACGDGSSPVAPPAPPRPPPPPDPRIEQIENQLSAMFGPAHLQDALDRFRGIQADVDAGRTAQAETKLLALVEFILDRLRADEVVDPAGSRTPEEAVAEVLEDLFDFADVPPAVLDPETLEDDGAAEVIGQGGGLVVTGTEFAGVEVPPGVFSRPTLVTITRIPEPPVPATGPLPTTLPQYPLFYEFSSSLAPQGQVTVGVCVLENPPEPLGAPTGIFSRLRLAHTDPQDPQSIEILAVAPTPFLDCTDASAGAPSVVPAGDGRIGAAAALRGRGLGGLATSFSPFGAVEPAAPPGNQAPVAAIASPANGSTFAQGQAITFDGTGSDPEDGALTGGSLAWVSSRDGQFGTGTSVTTSGLTVGTHTISLTATDSQGATGVATISLTVTGQGSSNFVSISAGGEYTCGVVDTGDAYCWGLNFGGTLGNGQASGMTTTPVKVVGGLQFSTVAAGAGVTCGLTTGGAAYCWGGFPGGPAVWTSPSLVPGNIVWASITVGSVHACGVAVDGTGYCWGDNFRGRLGDGTTTSRFVPTPVAGGLTFASIAAGAGATCGITTAEIAYCWGDNALGALGNGSFGGTSTVPVPVAGGLTFASISEGNALGCGITAASSPGGGGRAYCWGSNFLGNLGIGTTGARTSPTLVAGPAGTWTTISAAAGEHACGVVGGTDPYCWGPNPDGRLGDGTLANRDVPTALAGGLNLTTITAGDRQNTGSPGLSHSCGITPQGRAYCWGSNNSGQLGDGSTTDRLAPAQVTNPP